MNKRRNSSSRTQQQTSSPRVKKELNPLQTDWNGKLKKLATLTSSGQEFF